MYHKPVLLNESIDGLAVDPRGVYVDTTFGGGTHTRTILEKLTEGRLIAFDQDQEALANEVQDPRFRLVNRNYRYLVHFLRYLDAIPVDGILADLGISSHQIDTPSRGFSTRWDTPIDLRMNMKLKTNAGDILNNYPEEKLAWIFASYGELDHPGRLASLITERRSRQKIVTTGDLKETLHPAIPRNRENQFLAQVFQALRIEVNAELESLQELLQQSLKVLKPKGRLAIISYHSLEDRLVKNFMKTGNVEGTVHKDFYGNVVTEIRPVNRKPITPSVKELAENPRSRSAKLRIAEKI
ncbi:MAG: 16S rRNA (cytosine(1402)-N(4))-methyltransferase RsmH [Bacteroidetes bacterium]|nr:16S rRNA (cytosine(1402)-N(4))-methyltransferase RsmH [Bacteroidota bacterium]